MRQAGLAFVRYGIGATFLVAGLITYAFGGSLAVEGGSLFTGAGLAILFLNWLFRFGAEGDRERETEEAARRYFDEHGRWPDEEAERPPGA